METPLSLDPPQPWPGQKPPAGQPHVWQGKEFGFGDLIDTINPLQHIPVVSTLYRAITGDEIGNVPRVVGDTLFGGPLGFITGMVNVALREESGKDLGEHVLAMVTPEGAGDPAAGTQVASKPAADGDSAGAAAIAGKNTPDAAPAAAHATAAAVETAAAGQAMPPAIATGGTTRSISPFQVAARGDGDGDANPAFLAQSAASQRRLLGPAAGARGSMGAATARPLNNTPIPLQLPPIPGFAQGRPMRSSMAAATTVAAAAMPAQPVPTALPASAAGNAALPSNPPVEISQRMLDALNKYARMQQDRSGQPAAYRGGRVDVSQ
ncbi:MAG TPA: hypothetical protein VGD08_11625 [Stellaceae bacterium]